ncbi:MAG: ABC transporter substrate-binding protein [Thermoguttaceae bacterium]|nr:ABC transporter substrate-binding protein [Thermoguttaceae bacterium]
MKFKSSLEKVYRFIRFGVCLFLLILASGVMGCVRSETGTSTPNDAQVSDVDNARSLRIVSTVPSVTETLFVLGLGDYVVGVSDYCKYPEEVSNLPKIGSLYDYNSEAIAELNPDFVVVLKENDVLPQKMAALGVETIAVDHSSLEGVLDSYGVISNRVESVLPGICERAQRLRREIEEQIDSIRESVADKPKVKTLISIYRTVGLGKIGEAYVAGHNPYFDSVLEIVGATNAAGNLAGASPIITAEGILELNPEAILDLSTDGVKYEGDALKQKYDERVADWASLGDSVDAIKNNRVFPIFEDYATIPGPRTVLFLEELVKILHPDDVEQQ